MQLSIVTFLQNMHPVNSVPDFTPIIIPKCLHIRLCNKIFYYMKQDEKECRIFLTQQSVLITQNHFVVNRQYCNPIKRFIKQNRQKKPMIISHSSECTSIKPKQLVIFLYALFTSISFNLSFKTKGETIKPRTGSRKLQ